MAWPPRPQRDMNMFAPAPFHPCYRGRMVAGKKKKTRRKSSALLSFDPHSSNAPLPRTATTTTRGIPSDLRRRIDNAARSRETRMMAGATWAGAALASSGGAE